MRIIIFCFFLICALVTTTAKADVAHDRNLFLQAQKALTNNNITQFQILSNQLRAYPLYPYLVYGYLMRNFSKASQDQISLFLRDYANTPLADRVHNAWIIQLGLQKNWPALLAIYKPVSNPNQECLYLQALTETGKTREAFSLAPKLWLRGRSQPDACNAVFSLWKKQGGLTADLIWQRIGLAIEKKNYAFAKTLSLLLENSQQKQIDMWIKIHEKPELILQNNLLKPLHANSRLILLDAISKWAQKNPQQLAKSFGEIQKIYSLSSFDQQIIIREIGIGLARKNDPAALSWFDKVQKQNQNYLSIAWQIRNALGQQKWAKANAAIAALKESERHSSEWLFWQARILANLGRSGEALQIYQRLAQEVNYYGFLASEQLHQPYRPLNKNISASKESLELIANNPAVQRSKEWSELNNLENARSEWNFAISHLNPSLLPAAAKYADESGWYDRAIVALAKAKIKNAIALRYPLAYHNLIVSQAQQLSLQPAWIFAILRQESIFMTDAKSSVGAIGLMQLMPQTAKPLAKALHLSSDNLFNPDVNIRLGSLYLKNLASAYNGNIIQATAAYNAGPGNVKKWLSFYQNVPQDIWIELIPFQETRDYVKSVLLGRAIYQERLR
jgi:soluble lytic murein transglycosylase